MYCCGISSVDNHELIVEVCVDSLESAIASERGGARRVELCSGLAEGGVTPSAGLIATARQKISIGLHVMIRPRAGDFHYSADEFDVMRRDVLMAKQLGANGVVFGILDLDANIDIQRTRALVDLARPLKVTCHRAFDMSADLFRSLQQVAETGADRILTSGGAKTALEGAATLRQLVGQTGKGAVIMACGGINDQNVQTVVEKTAVREIPRWPEDRRRQPHAPQERKHFDGKHRGQRIPAIRRAGRQSCATDTSSVGA